VATFIGEANLLDATVAAVDGGTLHLAAGPLRFVAPLDGTSPTTGAPVTVSVRPEHVKVGRAAGPLANRWTARVADVSFMGSIVRCRLAVEGGPLITAEVHNDAAGDLRPGHSVPFGWAPEFAVILWAP
jgi:putative spermidine/putrescine transport system ATP-binding protein